MSRARGYVNEWKPQSNTQRLIVDVEAVLEEYRQHMPLTVRQVFYRLIGAHGYDKTTSFENQLYETLTMARRAGWLPIDAFRDDGTKTTSRRGGWSDPEEFLRVHLEDVYGLAQYAERYRRDPQEGQTNNVEVWCEAAGMVGQLARVARNYDVPVISSGGFYSLTETWGAARRLSVDGRPATVLYVGDHDPSGAAMLQHVAEDVEAFLAEDDPDLDVTFHKVAVTPEQISRLRLPTRPAKRTDRRGVWNDGEGTVQAEALPPDVLAEEVRVALEAHVDVEALRVVERAADAERAGIRARLEQIVEALP